MKREFLSSQDVQSAIENHYDVIVSSLNFLQSGYDPYTSNYRVTTDESTFFAKIFIKVQDANRLVIPAHLYDSGLTEVVAPIKNSDGSVKTQLQDFWLALFPYLDARPASDFELTLVQWQKIGRLLRRIHDVQLSEAFRSMMPPLPWMQAVAHAKNIITYQELLQAYQADDEIEQAFVVFWHEKSQEIQALLDRFSDLTQMLRTESLDLVLCHGDFHTGNVLIDDKGYYLVDWDSPLLTPPEADFNFVLSRSEAIQAAFFEGYGNHKINQLVVTYYSFKWALQEIDEYTEMILTQDDPRRDEALQEFKMLFAPYRDVEGALIADEKLRTQK